jgi:hypothetical protein
MEQRKLYKTLDNILKQAPRYKSNEELLKYVIEQIGDVKPIAKNYSLISSANLS